MFSDGSFFSDGFFFQMVRELIGSGGKLMVDCNQKWEVDAAVKWVRELSPSDIYWIEEPTHPDDIIG